MISSPSALISSYFELAASLQAAIYYPALASCLASCAMVKWGPDAFRLLFAIPNAVACAACLALGFFDRPDLYLVASMNFCPVLLWMAKAHQNDPMRKILLDRDESSR